MIEFNHFNFNVLDLEKSIAFYKEAIGLSVVREKDSSHGSRRLVWNLVFRVVLHVYLGDGRTGFNLELTWMRDRKEPYNLGDEEFHLAFKTDDYDAFHKKHEEMGCICYENPSMGIYFINDPDGYWIEIVPVR